MSLWGKQQNTGFTLAEVLIALALLGIIAAFAIPKILQSVGQSHFNSLTKEAIASVSEVYTGMNLRGELVSGTTKMSDIFAKMNATRVTDATIDLIPNSGVAATMSCATYLCYQMSNGGILFVATRDIVYVNDATHAISFGFDPDGKVTNPALTGPGKSMVGYLYPNGQLATYATLRPNTQMQFGDGTNTTYNPDATRDPEWLKF